VKAGIRVLVINPGSTSTKVGVFVQPAVSPTSNLPDCNTPIAEEICCNLHHSDKALEKFRGWPALAQTDFRCVVIQKALLTAGYSGTTFAAVAGRGGLLPPMECGTWIVNDAMIEELRQARRGDHVCNLGAVLALQFARAAGCSAYIVDPVTVDEWQDCARLSGTPLIERTCIGHALNIKAVARRFAREQERAYEQMQLIVVHLGSGITVSAHRGGRMVDQNTPEEGPFGPDRTGSLPVRQLVKQCFTGKFNEKQLDRMVFGEGGLFAYLGTRDLQEVERRMDAGDSHASVVYDAMVYQIAKETGAMAAVLRGHVDAVLLTGGMAHSERFVRQLRSFLEWIAPVSVYPGEDELRALAEGAFRVLNGEEDVKTFRISDSPSTPHRDRLVIGGVE
jgi:butyrate kinase